MRRIARVVSVLLFAAPVPLLTAGCTAFDPLMLPSAVRRATMTHEERGRLEEEKWKREYQRLEEARKAQEAAAAKASQQK